MAKIALDAGHGVNTAGKRTPDGEREWAFNNKVLLAAQKYLNEYEDVSILRLDDPTGKTDVPLNSRTNKANEWGADVLVSIHHNASTGKWGNWTGTETYIHASNPKGSRALATAVQSRLTKAYGLSNRGIKTANFHMLRESKMTAILTEGGFMDSRIDILKMRDDKVLDAAGKAIAEGVAEYLKLKKNPEPKPVSKPTGKLYKVQIGAFSNKDNADKLATEAKKKGFNVYIVQE